MLLPATTDIISEKIAAHIAEKYPAYTLPLIAQQFKKDGFIKIPEAIPWEMRQQMKAEALRLLENFAERRDLKLATTGNTPRNMSVVPSETIAANSSFINTIYRSSSLLTFLETVASEKFFPCPSKDEEFLISRHEKSGDTHGWHWGDYRYAMIWILEAPPLEYGGMLQCVPHTSWDKTNPRIHEYLCANPIQTYGFVTGDIYLLKSDTTLHRTVPLNRDATRIMLNMTWGCEQDKHRNLLGNDRWWGDKEVEAGIYS